MFYRSDCVVIQPLSRKIFSVCHTGERNVLVVALSQGEPSSSFSHTAPSLLTLTVPTTKSKIPDIAENDKVATTVKRFLVRAQKKQKSSPPPHVPTPTEEPKRPSACDVIHDDVIAEKADEELKDQEVLSVARSGEASLPSSLSSTGGNDIGVGDFSLRDQIGEGGNRSDNSKTFAAPHLTAPSHPPSRFPAHTITDVALGNPSHQLHHHSPPQVNVLASSDDHKVSRKGRVRRPRLLTQDDGYQRQFIPSEMDGPREPQGKLLLDQSPDKVLCKYRCDEQHVSSSNTTDQRRPPDPPTLTGQEHNGRQELHGDFVQHSFPSHTDHQRISHHHVPGERGSDELLEKSSSQGQLYYSSQDTNERGSLIHPTRTRMEVNRQVRSPSSDSFQPHTVPPQTKCQQNFQSGFFSDQALSRLTETPRVRERVYASTRNDDLLQLNMVSSTEYPSEDVRQQSHLRGFLEDRASGQLMERSRSLEHDFGLTPAQDDELNLRNLVSETGSPSQTNNQRTSQSNDSSDKLQSEIRCGQSGHPFFQVTTVRAPEVSERFSLGERHRHEGLLSQDGDHIRDDTPSPTDRGQGLSLKTSQFSVQTLRRQRPRSVVSRLVE